MYFLIENDKLLEKHTIWGNFSADTKKDFDSELVYNKKYFENQNKIS